MVANAEKLGLSITADGDDRVTRVGRFLRKHKLDELPQLWNVLRGEMSFVGPRPEVPRYVAQYTTEQKQVLELKPGITDLATLEFRDEEEMLKVKAETWKAESRNVSNSGPMGNGEMLKTEKLKAEAVTPEDGVEEFYLLCCLPRKVELSLAYANRASVWTDTLIILRTLFPFLAKDQGPQTTRPRDHGPRDHGTTEPRTTGLRTTDY